MIDLKPACREMIGLLAGVRAEQLADATPCSEYTVADLIAHIDDVAQGFAVFAGADVPATGNGASATGTNAPDVVGDRRDAARHVRALGEAWDAPTAWHGSTDTGDVELPNEVWGKIALTEVVVHGWDLAHATGQRFELPEDALRACLDHVSEFVPRAPLPELWGTAVDVPAVAPLIDRIVAITGRAPRPPLAG
ncbi:TIGR03086 family protein [Saccharopolyspora erythraea]|uniref:TIGR03086 family metal-binding protein n=1 Tax=Saccharopolyspora erythraea TaxID=1836 RepID=UPI001BA58A84|nr:TIGR03086 family metal-binding protein [Saccharopolyspora erythraea]QUH00695.1 TIGR03086 family protein [Saccharopolyspora erythraea]